MGTPENDTAIVPGEVFRLVDLARVFATRMKADEVAKKVEAWAWDDCCPSAKLVVDWDGVSAASPMFIDQFIGRLDRLMEENQPFFCEVEMRGAEEAALRPLVVEILGRRQSSIRYVDMPG